MARRKPTPFPPWQTEKPDGIEKRYIRLGNSQMLHPAMLSLSDKAFRIYVQMLLEAGGQRNLNFQGRSIGRLLETLFFRMRSRN